jgi:hypothetical protein
MALLFINKPSQMKITPSILSFLLFTLIIAIPPALLQYTGNITLLNPGFWTIFFFMSGLTFLVLVMMLIVQQKKKEFFAQAFLGGTTLKILTCLIFIFVFLSYNTINKMVFMGDFFYIYLLNTLFEVYVLIRNLRHKNSR